MNIYDRINELMQPYHIAFDADFDVEKKRNHININSLSDMILNRVDGDVIYFNRDNKFYIGIGGDLFECFVYGDFVRVKQLANKSDSKFNFKVLATEMAIEISNKLSKISMRIGFLICIISGYYDFSLLGTEDGWWDSCANQAEFEGYSFDA